MAEATEMAPMDGREPEGIQTLAVPQHRNSTVASPVKVVIPVTVASAERWLARSRLRVRPSSFVPSFKTQ